MHIAGNGLEEVKHLPVAEVSGAEDMLNLSGNL